MSIRQSGNRLSTLRLHILVLVVAASSFGAVPNSPRYPGSLPGPATIRAEHSGFVASNAVLEVTWSCNPDGLKIKSVRDKVAGGMVSLEGELFQIVMSDGRRYAASGLKLPGPPRISVLAPNSQSSRLAARLPGQNAELTLTSQDQRLQVTWRALLRENANYLRQEVEITPLDQDCVVAEVIWLDAKVPGVVTAGTVDGSPAVSGNFFFGLEDPHAVNLAGQVHDPIGSWSSADIELGKSRRKGWSIPGSGISAGTNEVVFEFKAGRHRLDISRVALLENGREVASDQHEGWTGRSQRQNTYRLVIPRIDAQAHYQLAAEIGTDPKLTLPPGQSIESSGTVSLRRMGGLLSFRLPRNAPLKRGETLTTSFVIGVSPQGQMRRAFLYYLEHERAHPYRPFLHYNTWYDISPWHDKDWNPYALNETNSLDAIRTFGERFIRPYGAKMDSMVFDEGWEDIDKVWSFHSGFPEGFAPHARLAKQYGTSLGVWLSPRGGGIKAKEHRLAAGAGLDYETNSAGFSLAGPKYYAAFKRVCLQMIRDYGVNHFKFDGIAQGATVTSTEAAGAGAAFLLDTDALRRLMLELREEDPNLFINFTTGSWPSPFWLRYADSTWRQGLDTGFRGTGPRQQRCLNYRDGETYKNIVQRGPLYPLNALMSGGITYSRRGRPGDPSFDSAGLKDDIRGYFGSGTGLQELYIQPSRLTTIDWAALAEAAKWSRANQDVLVDTHWIGGDPNKSEIYGWASWSPRKGIVTLRNPDAQPQEFMLDLAKCFELPANVSAEYRLKSPWAEDVQQPALKISAGKPQSIKLQPFEVRVLETIDTKSGP